MSDHLDPRRDSEGQITTRSRSDAVITSSFDRHLLIRDAPIFVVDDVSARALEEPQADRDRAGAEEKEEVAAAGKADAEDGGCMDAEDADMSDAGNETWANRATAEAMEAVAEVEAEMTGGGAPEPALAPPKPQRPAPKAAFLPFKKPRTVANAS